MAQLGALAGSLGGLGGAAGAIKNPSDQFVALMQSTTVQDRLIDQYELAKAYDKKFRMDVRKELESRVRINVAKKDSLIVIEVDDEDPKRAAAMANSHVDELRRLVSTLAVGEAQRRRVFFEKLLEQSRDQLTKAQAALQDSGVTAGTLRAEPRAATAAYARVQAEVAGAEVQLATLRGFLADSAHEVRAAQATLTALRAQLARIESSEPGAKPGDADYVAKYRDFKYQEMLFELMARQYEAARVDEAREGTMVQVVDVAQPPELKSRPRRGLIALGALVSTALLLLVWLRVRSWWREGLARRAAAPSP
jgi:capsule polysaccharide export protein KpsE/RkpR